MDVEYEVVTDVDVAEKSSKQDSSLTPTIPSTMPVCTEPAER